jgi:hypothetical protein
MPIDGQQQRRSAQLEGGVHLVDDRPPGLGNGLVTKEEL